MLDAIMSGSKVLFPNMKCFILKKKIKQSLETFELNTTIIVPTSAGGHEHRTDRSEPGFNVYASKHLPCDMYVTSDTSNLQMFSMHEFWR